MKLKKLFILLSIFGLTQYSCQFHKNNKHPNILFIAVDDLRADLGCYGNGVIHSPNLDSLASQGILFENHFVNVPTCGASRHCLLTGMRPQKRSHLWNNVSEAELSDKPDNPKPESFIHHLKRNGYHTVGIGKISHSTDGYLYGYTDKLSSKRELPHSWDELAFNYGKWGTGWNAFFGYANGENRQSLKKEVKPYEKASVSDTGYVDGLTTKLAINKLKELKNNPKPFFLGVGFFKPHLPFNSPEKYWNLYSEDSIPISPNPLIPKNIHLSSLHESGEFNQYKLGEEKAGLKNPVSDPYARKLRHAYYACISYIDHQIGLLLSEMETLGLDKNTIIIVWGDHGWHLGDQQVWGKHTIFENALKSTFIMKVPGNYSSTKISSIIETVDIYPSIMELCKIDLPYPTHGESFISILEGTDLQDKNVAYGYFNNGVTMRNSRYRLNRYYRDDQPVIELYDHLTDPLETVNIASERKETVDSLMPFLQKGDYGIYN